MKDVFNFNKTNVLRVQGEKISGFLMDVNALKVDGVTVCDIADLNKIQIEVSVKRNGGTISTIFNGKLNHLLTGLYAQTHKYDNCIKKLQSGYKMLIDFGGVLDIPVDDEFLISMRAEKDSFTLLSTVESSIEIETIPAIGQPTDMPILESISTGNGKTAIDEVLGSRVVAIIVANDFTASYDASTKSKIQDVTLSALGFDKKVSNNLLIAENMDMLKFNPESSVKQIVVYRAKSRSGVLNNVRLKANLSKGVDADARILVLRSKVI